MVSASVASLLKAGGYRTYIAGKWNVGNEPQNLPDQRGFDRSFIMDLNLHNRSIVLSTISLGHALGLKAPWAVQRVAL